MEKNGATDSATVTVTVNQVIPETEGQQQQLPDNSLEGNNESSSETQTEGEGHEEEDSGANNPDENNDKDNQ